MTTHRRTRSLALALSGALALSALPLHADVSVEDKSIADGMFRDGRRLFKEGKFAEACAKFEASQRLDPAAGTQLNLAACHYEEGKFATAYVELDEAEARAKKDKRDDRLKIVGEYRTKVAGKLTRLTITVPAEARIEGLTLTLDGKTLAREAWDVAFPLDPGVHTVTAAAPGHSTWTATVEIGKTADARSLAVPKLEAPKPAATESATPAFVAPPATIATTTTTTATTATDHDPGRPPGHPVRTWGIVLGVAGVAVAGAGTYFLLKSDSIRHDADGLAAGGDFAGANARNDDAKSARSTGWIGAGVGAALLVGGAVMFVVGGDHDDRTVASWQVAPMIGASGGGVSLGGRF